MLFVLYALLMGLAAIGEYQGNPLVNLFLQNRNPL